LKRLLLALLTATLCIALFIGGWFLFWKIMPLALHLVLKAIGWLLRHQTVLLILIIVVVTVFILIQSMDPQTTANIDNNTVNPQDAIKKAGEAGEREIAYQLSWLTMQEYKVINNVKLVQDEGLIQQFDHIVIGPNGIFNIETKNYAGTITIDQHGNWIREKNGYVEALTNPSSQVYRHRFILESFLDSKYPIRDLIAIANDKTIIKGQENNPIPVVRSDLLIHYILQNNESSLTQEDIENIYQNIISRSQQ